MTSLASFCAGSFLFSSLHGRFSPAQRWVVCASSLVQALLILGAAVTVTLLPKPGVGDEIGWHVLVPIALVALQSCGQAVTSRALKYNSLTSVVLTSIYCDLFSDAKLFALDNVDRNRRLSAPVLLVLGAFSGGKFAKSDMGIAGALWTAALLKLLVVVAWLCWPAEEGQREGEEG